MVQDFQYGAYYLQIARRDANGYPKGIVSDPDTVANDTTMHAYLMSNIISFTPPVPTRELATDRGGQTIRAQADMGVSDFGIATVELSEFDDVFNSYITNTGVEATNPSGFRQAAMNVNNVDVPSWFVVATAQVQSRSGSTITKKYRHWVLPNAQIRPATPAISQNGGVNPNPLSYEIVPNTSYRTLTGELFSATDMSVEFDNDIMYTILSTYPIGITSYTGNNATPETFILGYRPLTTQATTSDKLLTQNGVADTISTLSVTTGVVTTPQGTAGDIFVCVYSTIYQAI
jgi:hypothetical protein